MSKHLGVYTVTVRDRSNGLHSFTVVAHDRDEAGTRGVEIAVNHGNIVSPTIENINHEGVSWVDVSNHQRIRP